MREGGREREGERETEGERERGEKGGEREGGRGRERDPHLANTVAVVVPSPASSLVLLATSCTSLAPMFWYLSSSSIPLATVTPSLVILGLPQDFSRITLRPYVREGEGEGEGRGKEGVSFHISIPIVQKQQE